MTSKRYYCVVEDWQGEVSVRSFGGRNMTEERRYAKFGYRYCHKIDTNHDRAQRYASQKRREVAARK